MAAVAWSPVGSEAGGTDGEGGGGTLEFAKGSGVDAEGGNDGFSALAGRTKEVPAAHALCEADAVPL